MTNPSTISSVLQLNNGTTMPIIGLGTWKAEKGVVKQTVIQAVKSGYRHIDCASFYGNEKEVGEAFHEILAPSSALLNRSDLFVTSKLWNSHHGGHVRDACLQTLKDLQLEYLDLYLIHWPIAFEFNGLDMSDMSQTMIPNPNSKSSIKAKLAPIPIQDTWREMEKLVDEGLVKSIGVSNFSVQSLLDLVTYARIKPAVNQIEVHPYLNQVPLINIAKELGDIHTTGYSPFGSGRDGSPLQDSTLAQLGQKYHKTTAQIILRWNIQRGVAVIPKTVSEDRLVQNLQVFDFELSEEDMKVINALGSKNVRFINPMFWGVPMFA